MPVQLRSKLASGHPEKTIPRRFVAFNGDLLKVRPRLGLLLFGALLLLAGLFLPRDWCDALPRNPEPVPPPIKGITLLQLSLVIEGLMLVGLSFLSWRFSSIGKALLLPTPAVSSAKDGLGKRTASLLLATVTWGRYLSG
jgi:hypothetical protein